ncbi:Intron-binding protein aquarius N-terminal [Trinorchestia longiramus]|nr:Intron-binding protein aquarius N-terminal [Trinorchestia longiramus]
MKNLTVDQISTDHVTLLAQEYWLPSTVGSHKPYNPQIIDDIYCQEIRDSNFSSRRIVVLELSQYLEKYLWPNYSWQASPYHMLSVVVVINEKFRERIPAWGSFESHPGPFKAFFRHLSAALLDDSGRYSLREQMNMVVFLNHIYNTIESDLIREEISNTISYNILTCLSKGQLQNIFKEFPVISKGVKRAAKALGKLEGKEKEWYEFDTCFLYNLLNKFLGILSSIGPDTATVGKDLLQYCERFIELTIDLESQLPTRRYFHALLDSVNFVVKCQVSALANRRDGKLFAQLVYILKIFMEFEINGYTGEALTDVNVMKQHYSKVRDLQLRIFNNFEDMNEFCFLNVASVDKAEKLRHYLGQMSDEDLQKLCDLLHILPKEDDVTCQDRNFLTDVLVERYQRRPSQLEAINRMPLYPTEEIIWDDNIVPSEYFSGDTCLALPKLNLQFLTLHDYLLRNFDLFRLESTYEIRQDIEDIVTRMRPWLAEDGSVVFNGWARMAQVIFNFAVCEVAQPNVGEDKPSRVRADITVNLNVRLEIKNEWEALRKHDVCLLLSVQKPKEMPNPDGIFPEEYGISYVRGCEIEGMLDENGRVIEEGPEPKPEMKGDTRTFRVWLDCNQYKKDLDSVKEGSANEDVYQTFNVLMRRKPKENNFKAVLSTIRDLMNTKCVVPDWLEDIILGFGDPASAHYKNRKNAASKLDFNDTFLDLNHLKESFPSGKIVTQNSSQEPPFKLTFSKLPDKDDDMDSSDAIQEEICVESYTVPNRGPYPYTVPKKNSVRFTPTQIEAIRSGMQPGLTMVVGPPGTGKTDVAVQIISNLYHNNPRERTLIVTHSNQALNQLFEKIMCLDVDERHLLRLGHGEEALETEKDFSRYGRVNYVLNKRLELLDEVTRLKESLGVRGDMGASCETAGYFFLHHILSRWEKFQSLVMIIPGNPVAVSEIKEQFPFHVFFSNAPQPLFKERSYEEDMEIAKGCFRYLENIFTQLKEFKAFEMLRSGLDRTRYLLVKEAKIIAMTCTHAALKRHELVELGFQFDNILMEESAQILEIETFIPLLLQNPDDGRNRLKRWVMIGDHHQLPPVIKNMAFQKYSNMEQSLYSRFVRLCVPTIQLDAQGRARPSLCELYKWRYRCLGNLPHVISSPEYTVANPGLYYDYQLVNVEDLDGKGETEPRKYFYQNLAEAEYVVHLYMYMRLIGYPAEKISLLTTYNGQRELLRDVVEQRCAKYPMLGRPHKISTVDKYQGQQNDYILLSLVRTKAVGHLRDVRRLIVAMSRARLGLYVFARASLFSNCYELQSAFALLSRRPLELHTAPWERLPGSRPTGVLPEEPPVVIQDVTHMSNLVHQLYREACESHAAQMEEYQARNRGKATLAAPGTLAHRETQANTGAKYDSDHEDEDDTIKIINEVET